MRTAVLCCVLAVGVLVSVSAEAVTYAAFTDSSSINLLERWSPDGLPDPRMVGTYLSQDGLNHYYYYPYYYTSAVNNAFVGKPLYLSAWYMTGDAGMYSSMSNLPSTGAAAQIVFDTPKLLGKVSLQWRQADHTPSAWEIWDQTGKIASGTYSQLIAGGSFNGAWSVPVNTTVPSQFLEIRTTNISGPTGTVGGTLDLIGMGAYVKKGQKLSIDGTFNVFQEENGRMLSRTLTLYNASGPYKPSNQAQFDGLTNLSQTGNPGSPNEAGELEWHFAREYTFVGAMLTHMFRNDRGLLDAQVWVSNDEGVNWTPLIRPELDQNKDPIPLNWKTGYITFDTSLTDDDRTGSWVKLTWGPGSYAGGLSELTQFQLFGYAIPEPATMALLALGGLALLRRRR